MSLPQKDISIHRFKRMLMWMLLDSLVIFVTYLMTFSSRALTAQLDLQGSMMFFMLAILVTVSALYISGAYRRIWSHTSGHGSIIILRAIVLASIILLFLDLMSVPRMLPLSVLIIANIISCGGLIATRYRSRLIGGLQWRWRVIWKGEFPNSKVERVLVIGAGESGQMIAMRFQHRIHNSGYNIIGFVDDDRDKYGMYVEGKPVLGTTEDTARITLEQKIDLIIIAIHNIKGSEMRRIIEQCQLTDARIKAVPDMIAFMSSNVAGSYFLRDIQPEDLIGRSIVKYHDSVDLTLVSKRVVLVTGAAGSIGSELCRQILSFESSQLIMLDNNESALHDLHIELEAKYPGVSVIPALIDVTSHDNLREIFERYKPQLVFHAAAYKHVPMLERYPEEAIRVNISGTLNVAELAISNQVERFVLISTDKAVKPSSIMGASKRLCELIIHNVEENGDHDTLFTAVRFGNVLGSRGSVVPTFMRQIESGGPVTVTHKEMTRYFMSISEAANLVIHATAMTQGNDVFVLKMGEEIRILDIAERIIRLHGLRPHMDIEIKYIGIRNGEKLHEDLYTYYEEPVGTVHPKVMKINLWQMNGQGNLLMEGVSRLIDNGFPDKDLALSYMLDLCEMGEEKYTILD